MDTTKKYQMYGCRLKQRTFYQDYFFCCTLTFSQNSNNKFLDYFTKHDYDDTINTKFEPTNKGNKWKMTLKT